MKYLILQQLFKMAKRKTKKKEAKKNYKVDPKNRQLYWILGVMIGLIAVFVVSNWVFDSFNSFEYEGLSFTKEKYGELEVYHYYYYFENPNGGLIKYNLFLQLDPRKNDVPIINHTEFHYPAGKKVYISSNPEGLIPECQSTVLRDLGGLATFFAENGREVRSGLAVEELAEAENSSYITCETRPERNVFIFQSGEETEIIRKGEFCTIVNIANCETMEAVEKIKIQTVIDGKNRLSTE
jgi:hypothetical protein